MKHKFLWTLIGVMAVAALVLAACAPPSNGNGNGNGEDEPQYGGTITFRRIGAQMLGFDPLVWNSNSMLSIIFDRYYTIPWEKGPAGTGELGTLQSPFYPRDAYVGEMLESFEVIDLYRATFTLREGLHYWDKAPVNGRELTVDDIIWNWLRDVFHERAGSYLKADPASALSFWEEFLQEIEDGVQPEQPLIDFLEGMRDVTPQLEEYYPGLEDMLRSEFSDSYTLVEDAGYDTDDMALLNGYLRKIDDYNFEIHTARCNRDLYSYIHAIWPTPREVTEVDGFTDWETVVGTGPWIPTSFDVATGATFARNPDYGQYDPIHPENQLPYADELQILMIEDETAFYAALQTAQLDTGAVEWHKVGYFQETSPEMQYIQGISGLTHGIFLRNDIPPFEDIRVRHACMLAIDHQAMMDHYQGFAQLHTWPEQMHLTAVYTPFDQLPTETQELYGYDPERAIELLEEAGYPLGFSTEMIVYPSSEDRESCQIVQAYLAAVGIDIELQIPDAGGYMGVLMGRNYEHMISCWFGNAFPADALNWAEGGVPSSPYNIGRVDDPQAYETSLAISCMADEAHYYALIKEDDVRRLGMMYQILVPTPVGGTFWWPWLKGYHGEGDLGTPAGKGWGEIPKYLWVDADLKDDMTG